MKWTLENEAKLYNWNGETVFFLFSFYLLWPFRATEAKAKEREIPKKKKKKQKKTIFRLKNNWRCRDKMGKSQRWHSREFHCFVCFRVSLVRSIVSQNLFSILCAYINCVACQIIIFWLIQLRQLIAFTFHFNDNSFHRVILRRREKLPKIQWWKLIDSIEMIQFDSVSIENNLMFLRCDKNKESWVDCGHAKLAFYCFRIEAAAVAAIESWFDQNRHIQFHFWFRFDSCIFKLFFVVFIFLICGESDNFLFLLCFASPVT